MKLSVMTYRASSERLNLLRQSSYGTSTINPTRRGSSLDSWLLSNASAPSRQAVYRKAYSDRLISPPPPRRAKVVSFDLSDDDDYDDDQYFTDDADDEVSELLIIKFLHVGYLCYESHYLI